MPQVLECYSISGEFDYLLKVIARDMDEYVKFSEALADTLSAPIKMSTHVVMTESKMNSGYPLAQLVEL